MEKVGPASAEYIGRKGDDSRFAKADRGSFAIKKKPASLLTPHGGRVGAFSCWRDFSRHPVYSATQANVVGLFRKRKKIPRCPVVNRQMHMRA